MNLEDKVCVITGAASSIGNGMAERFIADGAKIVAAAFPSNALTGQSLIVSHGWSVR